jgi:secretion/DNA translocation related CpaE-like protein
VSPPLAAVPSRPLVVSSDEGLLDDLLRVLAAAGAEPELATGGAALRRAHRTAPLVLVGADALPAAPLRRLPRRPGVVVVAGAELPAADWAAAVELGAERVAVLPDDENWLLSRAARAVRAPVERGRLVVVGGSGGGAGASTLAAAVALSAAARWDGAVLVDGDPHGGGLDLVLGAEREEGLRWPELAGLRGRVSGEALLAALPETAGVHVLAASRDVPCAVPGEALGAVVEAVRAAGRTVVVDLPRGAAGGAELLDEADLPALVVPARLRAACAARLLMGPGADGGHSGWSRAEIVARRVPGGLSAAEVADVVGRDVLAELPHDRAAVRRGERGEPPGVSARSAWGAASRRLLEALEAR